MEDEKADGEEQNSSRELRKKDQKTLSDARSKLERYGRNEEADRPDRANGPHEERDDEAAGPTRANGMQETSRNTARILDANGRDTDNVDCVWKGGTARDKAPIGG